MSDQLFNGQTNHPLSHEELTALCDKTTLFCKKSDVKTEGAKLHDAFIRLNSTPTGRETLRHMLNDNNTYHYSLNGTVSTPKNANGVYRTVLGQDRIAISPEIYNQANGRSTAAVLIAHESVHDMQTRGAGEIFTHQQAKDAETQALNNQLGQELGSPAKFCPPNYDAVYKENFQKWLEISQNPEKTPNGALRFEPLPGVDVERARKAYAIQMASQETRATYVRDFVRHGYVLEGQENPPFQFDDETTKLVANAYRERSENSITPTGSVSEQTVDDYRSRNPFISQEDFNPLRTHLGDETIVGHNEIETPQPKSVDEPTLPTGQGAVTHATQTREAPTATVAETHEAPTATVDAPILPTGQSALANTDVANTQTREAPTATVAETHETATVDAPILPTTRGAIAHQETQQRTIDPSVLAYIQNQSRQT